MMTVSRLAATGLVPLTRMDQVSIGGKLSDEHDFFSATVNASIAHDFNDKEHHAVVRGQ